MSSGRVLDVLVDADNVPARRVQPVLDLLAGLPESDWLVRVVGSGRPAAMSRLRWPVGATLVPSVGWQRADLALATAYRPSTDPLVLVSGDGDFGLLAARHPGPVLVVSSAASLRLQESALIVDPAREGTDPVRRWLAAVHG